MLKKIKKEEVFFATAIVTIGILAFTAGRMMGIGEGAKIVSDKLTPIIEVTF